MKLFKHIAFFFTVVLSPIIISAQLSVTNYYHKQGEKSATLLTQICRLSIEGDKRKEHEGVALISKFLGNFVKTVTPISYFLTQKPSRSTDHHTALHNLRNYCQGFAHTWQTFDIQKLLTTSKLSRIKAQKAQKAHRFILTFARDLSHARDVKHIMHVFKNAKKQLQEVKK